MNMGKKIEYNQTRFLDCINKLEHIDPINASYTKELELLYQIINGELKMCKETIDNIDISTINSLMELVANAIRYTSEEKPVLESIMEIVELKSHIDVTCATELCVSDEDFF